MEGSVIMDMGEIDDESDYELNGPDRMTETEWHRNESPVQMTMKKPSGDVHESLKTGVASFILESGRQQATKAWSLYANIDILRPYFDVEPKDVQTRLLQSFLPYQKGGLPQTLHRELYGPTMAVFTLIALLLFQMKTSGHIVQEGSLMGTAFGICFGYWFGISSLLWALSYICNTHITMLQILCLLGYGLCGHCVVIFLGTVIHTAHDHLFFYVTLLIFAGLSTLRMVSILTSRTMGQTRKLVVCGVVATVHILFLVYLHFAYHQIVESFSEALKLDQPLIPLPATILHQNNLIEDDLSVDVIRKAAESVAASIEPVKASALDVVKPFKETLINKTGLLDGARMRRLGVTVVTQLAGRVI